ncbi:hypothetical protein FJZ31_08720 [Candidatus Poribacteria bacterium]|nr:hypothetical protein [Candidatus Poribacteria bacterium]
MKNYSEICKKCTKQLLQQMSVNGNDRPIEVIIRLRHPNGLKRSNSQSVKDSQSIVQEEKQNAQQLMENLVEFLHQLENEGAKTKLLDTSWLTHSVLAVASPPILRKLAERDDVDIIDINAEIRGIAHPRPAGKANFHGSSMKNSV